MQPKAVQNNQDIQAEKKATVAEMKMRVLAYANANLAKDVIDKQCKSFKVESLADLNAQQLEKYIYSVQKNGGQI